MDSWYGQFLQSPVLVHLGVQEILVDGDQLVAEDPVEKFDNFRVTLHGTLLLSIYWVGAAPTVDCLPVTRV